MAPAPIATHRGARLGLPETGPGSLASAGRRVAALSLDWLAATVIVRASLPTIPYGSQTSALLVLGVFALEVIVLTWLGGGSFGQRLAGIVVLRRGRRLSLLQAVLRTLLICLVIPAAIWDSDGRGWHDLAVDSVVVRRPG